MIFLKNRMKKDEVLSEIKNKKLDSNILYIQPDYELALASNDNCFNSQWGLSNSTQVAIKQPSVQSDVYDNEISEFDRNALEMLVNDPVKLDILVHTLEPLPIDDPQYRSILDDIKESYFNHEPIDEEILNNLFNEYIAEHKPRMDMFIHSLPGDIADILRGNRIRMEAGYSVDARVVPAWEHTEGAGVVVAVIAVVAVLDTGIDVTHEDLAENIWTNSAEIPDNGIDDDENGFIDDNGWNFVENNNQVHRLELAVDEAHGTQIAGIIATT